MAEGCWDNGREVCSPRMWFAWQNTLGIGQEPNRRAGNTVCTSPVEINEESAEASSSETFGWIYLTEACASYICCFRGSYFVFRFLEMCSGINVKWEIEFQMCFWIQLLLIDSHKGDCVVDPICNIVMKESRRDFWKKSIVKRFLKDLENHTCQIFSLALLFM